ncbi:hypothetical protein HDV00_008166 [Rhizophlyctis rosea]|nr:hypothetical protein HDV00_008166 [Rhizophlyctis rosea]
MFAATLKKTASEALMEDGEEVYSLTPKPVFLQLARAILVENVDKLGDLKDNITDAIAETRAKLPDLTAATKELHTRFNIECGLMEHYYSQDVKALSHFESATKSSDFKWSMTGAMGKRTKFQTFDVAQLVVMAESSTDDAATEVAEEVAGTAPKTLDLNDDTLLETVAFTEKTQDGQDPSKQGNLKVIDQCILLAFCLNVKNVNPMHGLTAEEMLPYIRRVLENANNWMVHTMALLLRTRIEGAKSRTVERAALQLQALVDQFPLTDSPVSERMHHFFSIMLPPKWELEGELGERFVSLGVTRSALEIFERLELWENVISCYQMLEQEKKAEEVVLERLKVTPESPKLHCILGDLRKDPSLYEKAWKLSDGRFARAMRSLGAYYFRKGEWVKSIECYHRALAINPLFENAWFVLGCAAMRAEDWDQAVRAFSRVTHINAENGEAWTNLASVYIKQGQKREGWRALREAIKEHFDNSKIWENYMFTSTDLGEFSEAMRAMDRVLDIRGDKTDERSLVDEEVLEILVGAVIRGTKDAKDQSAAKLAPKTANLLDKILTRVSSSPRIFKVCADFARSQNDFREALEYEQKRYRVLLHQPGMDQDEEMFKRTAQGALDLSEALVELGPRKQVVRMEDGGEGEEVVVCKDWAYQARMVLRTLMGRTKEAFGGHPSHDALKEALKVVTEAARG